MSHKKFFKKFTEYDSTKPQIVKEIAGLLGIPINGSLTVEVPNRNGFVYVRLRNNTNELIQAFNEKVSPVYGLPVLVKWNLNRYEIISRDTNRYQDWGSFSSFLPRHGSQHSLNFEDGQGGDVTWIYSRQVMPFATVPSGTEGAGTVFVMPHVYRNPTDASWNYIGDESSANFLPAKPTGTSARMMLLVWNLETGDPLIITGSFLSENLTGTSSVISSVPTVTNQNYVPLAAIRLVSGTQSILWDNIYDMRQWAVTTPSAFQGGFSVWDEGIPQGTGTVLDFVGDNVQASVSGSVVRVYVTGSAGGSTVFSGVDQIGVFGQDEGVPIGTGTILNFVGSNVDVSRSGTVLRVFVTGSTSAFAGVDQIGVYGLDDGVPQGTGTWLDFGNNLSASRSGTVIRIDASASAPIQTDGFLVQDEGILLGTGTVLNFVGAGVTATLSGTVFNINIPEGGTSFSGVDQIGIYGFDEGAAIGTGTSMNFIGAGVTASRTGTMIFVEIPGGGDGGGGGMGIVGTHLGQFLATGTSLDVRGGFSASGTVLNLNAIKTIILAQGPMSSNVGEQSYGNLPAADTNTRSNLMKLDLGGLSQCRLFGSFGQGATATTSGTIIHLKYTTEQLNWSASGTFNELASSPDTEGRLYWITNRVVDTGWFNINPAASADNIYIKGYTTGGNGVADPTYHTILAEFR